MVAQLWASEIETHIGRVSVVASDDALCMLEYTEPERYEPQMSDFERLYGGAATKGRNKIHDRIERELDEYFEGKRRKFSVPLDMRGTEFQLEVWRRLIEIPYGMTTSYGALARKMGRPDAQRAVGMANGDNRLAIVVPCHRVVASDGSLHGYGGGLWRKKRLLDLEQGQTGLF